MPVAIQDRFVEVIARVTVGRGAATRTEWQVASGFLIDGRHVLTSLHAVADGDIEVRRAIPWPDGPKMSWRARVLLRGRVEHADLAVLELTEDTPADIGRLPPIGFARIADRTERLEMVEDCGAVGFPRFLERGHGAATVRQAAQVSGRIPVSQRPGPGLLTLQTGHRPEGPPLPSAGTVLAGSAWSGMSGAAVLAGDLVVGVVSEHAPRQGASDLTIVPITLIDTLPDRDAWWALLGTRPGRLRTLPAAGGAVWAGGCPYQGLAPFGPEQALLFHGRGQATARLQEMVTAERVEGGLVMVTGVSGAGKSSLLHAGLLPALEAAHEDPSGCSSWPQVCFTPSERPLQELAVQLAVRCGADPDVVLAELLADPARARTRARQVLAAEAIRRRQLGGSGRPPRRLIMVVDQFEELFASSWRGHAEEAAAFVAALDAIATPPAPPPAGPPDPGLEAVGRQGADRRDREPAGIVVLAVRGDFIDRCAAHPALARALEERAFVLGPMSASELRRAIVGPAAAAGLRLQDGLAEHVVRDLVAHSRAAADGGSVSGALPLLSMAMVRTWHNRQDGRLTLHGYDRSGGVASAVEDAAEDVYGALPPRQREAAQGILLALTLIGADGQAVRQRATISELAARCEPAEPEVVSHVVTAFTQARLMVTGSVPAPAGALGASGSNGTGGGASSTAAGGTVELAHDVLLTAWPRLHAWLAEDRADRRLHGEICQDATEWAQADQDASFLYRGIRLETAQRAAASWHADPGRHLWLPEVATAFLHVGARAATRTRHRRQALLSALAGLLVIAIITAIAFVRSARDVERRRTMALSSQLVTDSKSSLPEDVTESARLAAAAWAVAETDEARVNMATLLSQPARAVLSGDAGRVFSATFSPDGTRIASGADDGTVRIRDAATHRQIGAPLAGHTDEVFSVAFNRDGTRLASAGVDGTVRIWDAGTHRQIGAPLRDHTDSVSSVAFSRDGTRLVSGGADGTVRIWDVASGSLIRTLTRRTDWVRSVAFSPDGTRIASGGDKTVRIWDAATGEQIGTPLTGHTELVRSVAFSRDGTRIASGGADRTVRIWDVASGSLIRTLTGHTHEVYSVAFAPDGTRLASAGTDETVRLWDAATGDQVGDSLIGHAVTVFSVAFSRDGARLVSGGADGTVRIWDAAIGRQVGTALTGHTEWVSSVAFSPDGTRLASAGEDKKVRIWNAATRSQIGAPLAGHTDGVSSVAFSPDGARLVSGGADGTVRIWDAATGNQSGASLTKPGWTRRSAVFTSDGTRIVSAGTDGTVRIWDAATGEQLGASTIRYFRGVFPLPFSLDGTRVANGDGGTVRIWDAATGEQVGAFPLGRAGAVSSMEFSPDGTRIVSGGDDGTVRIWDTATGEQIRAPLIRHTDGVVSVAFSRDGTRVASGGVDGTVRIWDAATGEQIGTPLTGHTKMVRSVAFSRDGTRLVSGGADGTVRIWDVALPTDPDGLLKEVCGIAIRPFTPEEWQQRLPDEQYEPNCPVR